MPNARHRFLSRFVFNLFESARAIPELLFFCGLLAVVARVLERAVGPTLGAGQSASWFLDYLSAAYASAGALSGGWLLREYLIARHARIQFEAMLWMTAGASIVAAGAVLVGDLSNAAVAAVFASLFPALLLQAYAASLEGDDGAGVDRPASPSYSVGRFMQYTAGFATFMLAGWYISLHWLPRVGADPRPLNPLLVAIVLCSVALLSAAIIVMCLPHDD